jgi:Flp pilus assembly pilin Flp
VTRRSIITDERGLSTVEYVIILALIAIVAIGAWSEFGTAVQGKVDNATKDINGLDQ